MKKTILLLAFFLLCIFAKSQTLTVKIQNIQFKGRGKAILETVTSDGKIVWLKYGFSPRKKYSLQIGGLMSITEIPGRKRGQYLPSKISFL